MTTLDPDIEAELKRIKRERLAREGTSKGNGANGSATTAWWRQDAVTGAELQHMTFPPLRFVVPDLMPEGVALLAGKPKAGKSWMALDIAIAATSDRCSVSRLRTACAACSDG
jgi:AAA domain